MFAGHIGEMTMAVPIGSNNYELRIRQKLRCLFERFELYRIHCIVREIDRHHGASDTI